MIAFETMEIVRVAVVAAALGTAAAVSVSGLIVRGSCERAVPVRVMAQPAPLLLLDESTGSLALGHAQQVLELVPELCAPRAG